MFSRPKDDLLMRFLEKLGIKKILLLITKSFDIHSRYDSNQIPLDGVINLSKRLFQRKQKKKLKSYTYMFHFSQSKKEVL